MFSRVLSALKKLIMIPSETVSDILLPPSNVRGLTKWDPKAFEKTVTLPHIELPAQNIAKKKGGQVLKQFKLKIPNFQSIIELSKEKKKVVLDPSAFENMSTEDREHLENDLQGNFGQDSYLLGHTNYPSNVLFKAIFPENVEGLSASTIVGHITYINLRDELIPYKEVIGQILLDSNNRTKLVVTKTNTIENKFRNLDLEVLAGDPKLGFEVIVKETGINFKLDFAKVYWNPRLSTEHERIVNLVQKGDLVFDVMAGVGPFAVPIAKKGQVTKKSPIGITVHANDLNPSSYHFLKENMALNKVQTNSIHCYNLDGAEFIKTIIGDQLIKYYQDNKQGNVHILMNLPALATTFLPNFRGIIDKESYEKLREFKNVPKVHVYAFSKSEDSTEDLTKECCNQLEVKEIKDISVNYVRDVAPKKIMYRVSFPLTFEMMLKIEESQEAKKIKLFQE